MFWRFTYSINLLEMLLELTGSGQSNMAASKTEVPISKIVDKIGINGSVSRSYQKV